MKKFLYVLLVFVLSFALFACNPGNGKNDDDSPEDLTPGDIGELPLEEGEDPATAIVRFVLGRVVPGGVPGGTLKWAPAELIVNGGDKEISFWDPADIGTQYGRIKIYFNGVNAAGTVVKTDAVSQTFEIVGIVAGQRNDKTETAVLRGVSGALVPDGLVVKLTYPHASDFPQSKTGIGEVECTATYLGVSKLVTLWAFSVSSGG